MDLGKTIGLVALVAVGGLALYFFSKRSGSGAGAGGTITIGDETYPIPTEPGTYVFPGNGGNGDLLPEYVPPPTYPTQAPTGDELYPLGTQENPLYAEIPGELVPMGSWYDSRDIQATTGMTREQYIEGWGVVRETPAVERTVEQQYAYGYSPTIEHAEESVKFKDRVRMYGGDYVGGVMVAPDNWGGSVTEYAKYVRSTIDRTGMGWIN